jgi:hypothetical protein
MNWLYFKCTFKLGPDEFDVKTQPLIYRQSPDVHYSRVEPKMAQFYDIHLQQWSPHLTPLPAYAKQIPKKVAFAELI